MAGYEAESQAMDSTPSQRSYWRDLFENRPPTPDYLTNADYGPSSENDTSETLVEPGLFEISIVPSSVRRSTFRPVDSSSDPSVSSAGEKQALRPPGPPPIPDPQFSKIRDVTFVFTVCMAQFMSLAGLAQSVAPLFIIGDSFSVSDPGSLSWYAAAYSLTVGTFILPAGRLGDMFGHKKIFLIGWMWYCIWSLVAGISTWSGSVLFSIARGFEGIGPALLVPNAMALIGRTYPVGFKKNFIFSCFGAGGPTGFVVGAVFSALFSQLVWWPWAYWALSIACVFMFGLSLISVPADSKRAPPVNIGKPSFDWLGAVTGVSGLILVNFAWNQGPVVGWQVPYVYILLIVGVFSMIAFFIVELRFTRYPLIPLRGLRKEAGYALACIAAGWGSHGIWLYYIFWFLQRSRGTSALLTTAQTSPVAVVGTAFALSVGWLMLKVRPAYVMLLAMLCFFVGSVLIATAPVDQSYWIQTFLSILIMPGGMNLSFPAGTILLSNALPKENQGIAASLVSTTVNYSISIGLGLAGTIDRYVTPDTLAPGGQNLLRGFRGAWWFGAGLDALGIFIALYFVWVTRPDDGKIKCLKTAVQVERRERKEKRASRRQQALVSTSSSNPILEMFLEPAASTAPALGHASTGRHNVSPANEVEAYQL